MDKSWIRFSRLNGEYEEGVDNFIKFATENTPNNNNLLKCPCKRCACKALKPIVLLREHLFVNGFDEGYTKWIWHGENVVDENNKASYISDDDILDDRLHDMIRDVQNELDKQPQMLEQLIVDAERPLYCGCVKFTCLSALLKLFNLKARNGWSDKGFTELLDLIKDMLPEDNNLPSRLYEATKLLCPMGMGYKKIHACPNDCLLYSGEYENLNACVKCGTPRFKRKERRGDGVHVVVTKGPPVKVYGIFPLYRDLEGCLPIQKMLKILHGIQLERLMVRYVILQIPSNGN